MSFSWTEQWKLGTEFFSTGVEDIFDLFPCPVFCTRFPHLCRLGVAGRFLRSLLRSSSPAARQLTRSSCLTRVLAPVLVLTDWSWLFGFLFLLLLFVFGSSLTCHAHLLDPDCSMYTGNNTLLICPKGARHELNKYRKNAKTHTTLQHSV